MKTIFVVSQMLSTGITFTIEEFESEDAALKFIETNEPGVYQISKMYIVK